MVVTAVAEALPTAQAPPAPPPLSAKAAEQIGQKLYEAGFFLRVADLLLDLAEDRVAVGFGLGGAPAPPAAALAKSAQLLRTSADAVMNYLDGVVLQGQATEAGVSLALFRWAFMARDIEYALAYSTYLALNQLSLSASPYAKLGPSMMLYSTASSLIAKYYSLSAELGEDGTIKSVKEKALISMLEFALQNTRESIALAKQNGVDPVFATLYYEAAQSLREGAVEEKLTAARVSLAGDSATRAAGFADRRPTSDSGRGPEDTVVSSEAGGAIDRDGGDNAPAAGIRRRFHADARAIVRGVGDGPDAAQDL